MDIVGVGKAVEHGDEIVSKTMSAFNELFPEIAMGSRRRGFTRDTAKLREELSNIDSNENLNESEKRVVRYSLYQNLGHVNNLTDIANGSVPLIQNPDNARNVDPDWIDEFQDKASRCSDSEIQKLWSQILAGEIDSPGSHPKRLLSILSTLDKTEAEFFKTVCSYGARQYDERHPAGSNADIFLFIVDTGDADDAYNHGALPVKQLIALVESGLLISGFPENVNVPGKKFATFATSAERVSIVNSNEETAKSLQSPYALTQAGKALASLCDLGTANDFHEILKAAIPNPGGVYVAVAPLETPASAPVTYL